MPKIIHIIFLQIFQSVVNASLFLFFKPVARGFEPWEVRDVKKISRWDIFSPDEQPSINAVSRLFASNRSRRTFFCRYYTCVVQFTMFTEICEALRKDLQSFLAECVRSVSAASTSAADRALVATGCRTLAPTIFYLKSITW